MPYSGVGAAAPKNSRHSTPATSQNPAARGSAARRAAPVTGRRSCSPAVPGCPRPVSAPRTANAACPWVGSSAPIATRVSQLLAKMSAAQKVTVLTGARGSSYVGFTPAIGALCIPAMNLEDGPAGVGDGMASVTQLPAPVDVAATWDTAAERLYGQVIGAEQGAKGSSVDLGPTINIVRDPRWGRAFESIGGRQLAELVLAEVGGEVFPPAGAPSGMQLPILRETRMAAVMCEVGAPGLVVEHTAELAKSLTRAFARWAHGPANPG